MGITGGRPLILVSACLAGFPTRYDGSDRAVGTVLALVREGQALPVCPEQLGGLPTPREPAEIVGGDGENVVRGEAKVLTRGGTDRTAAFVRGAVKTAELAERFGITEAWLAEGSPSCGVDRIHDGSFQGGWSPGPGVTGALLQARGLQVRGI